MAYYFSPFRKKYSARIGKKICPFCDPKIIRSQTIKNGARGFAENENYRLLVNYYPKFEGHIMVVPKEHLTKLGREPKESVLDRDEMVNLAVKILEKVFPGCGFEIFLQTGAGSESSVQHLHWHVVPASPEDKLRSFAKLGHFYTTKAGEERVIIFPQKISRSPSVLKKQLEAALRKEGQDAKKSNRHGRRKGHQASAA